MKSRTGSSFLIGLLSGVFLVAVFIGGAVSERIWGLPILKNIRVGEQQTGEVINQRVVNEESVVTEVAERVSPGVVTVSVSRERPIFGRRFLDPFGIFSVPQQQGSEREQVDIGTGFVVDRSGLVVTNRHVVDSGEPNDYKVILKDNSEYQVERIWRDPANDLAILKISPSASSGSAIGFEALELGDSDKLKVGNFVIAIGTALGEFRHTVTTGVVSGLGRGITAGDGFSFAEELSNVIQTDAAINPGNSGGPLLNSAGQVIGVNVAVSQGANNIGFALPINLVKESLNTFNQTGRFDRPFFGVRYQMISTEQGILNNVPAGAYVVEVVPASSADRAGIKKGDIIVGFDGRKVVDFENGLIEVLGTKKIGDKVEVEVWRNDKTEKITVELRGE